MSLVKSPQMTNKKVAANDRNRKLSHGPVTDEGCDRIRAARLRHGFYAEAEEVAMRALGEDPVHFQERAAEIARPSQCTADAANAGFQLPRSPARHQPAAED